MGREFWTDYSDRSQPDFYKRHLYAERSASYNPYVQLTAFIARPGRHTHSAGGYPLYPLHMCSTRN